MPCRPPNPPPTHPPTQLSTLHPPHRIRPFPRPPPGVSTDGRLYTWGWGGATAPGMPALLPDGLSGAPAAAPGSSGSGRGRGAVPPPRVRLGGGQLGVGSGTDLHSPTLVTKLEVAPGAVLRQDGGDPFNFQVALGGCVAAAVCAVHYASVKRRR